MPREPHEELGCFGYYGFGSGHEFGRRGPQPGGAPMHCSSRPKSQECWDRRRERAAALFPAAQAEADRILAGCGGDGRLAVLRYSAEHGMPPPDIAATGRNLQDGAEVARGRKPRDRGIATLAWPLDPPAS